MQIVSTPARLLVAAAAFALVVPLTADSAAAPLRPTPGAAGVGDPYFPRDGNRGYQVRHYGLDLRYRPETNRLAGKAVISARATKSLSGFNLDLDGLRVRSVRVNRRAATWSRARGELAINPAQRGLDKGERFRIIVRYHGVPQTLRDGSGFIHTRDGAMVIGQPHVAATWFPVNDHPSDKAAYTFRLNVPRGLEAVANGVLKGRHTKRRSTTWVWNAKAPMASYLATANVGQFKISAYRRDGIRYWDAIDPVLLKPVARPRTGDRFAIGGRGSDAYRRLSRVIRVPANGARLSFSVKRNTEPFFDFMFVEAHAVGSGDWTMLPDRNGHTTRKPEGACAYLLQSHPFLEHYLTPRRRACEPQGTTGRWRAASGQSDGYERWSIDLSRYAGQRVDVSITYATDYVTELDGVFVDDIVVSTGEGSTSFEDDGNPMDGWRVESAPPGSPGDRRGWVVGTAVDTPPSPGEFATRSFAKQDNIIRFLSRRFGQYPFKTAGGIVDDDPDLGFALETQTRPVYSKLFFTDQVQGDLVVVHELAHQWYGDSVTVKRWKHIWLNEGFATYAEWMWRERRGLGTARQLFRSYASIPADDPFWSIKIGDPGPDELFHTAVYDRGAMTLHRLRQRVGDKDFFRILRRWYRSNAGGLVTTRQFIRHAERISGENMGRLFHAWLFTTEKPDLPRAEPRQALLARRLHQRDRGLP